MSFSVATPIRFAATASRVAVTDGPILILHDTTEFTYHRVRPEPVGVIGQYPCRSPTYDRRQLFTVCGLLMHASLGVTPDGLPLGLCAIKFWTRTRFKGTTELKRHINPTRVPIEDKESLRWLANMRQSSAPVADPARCIHIGDRESDIYELFVTAHELGTHFLVRSFVDRRADDGTQTIIAAMDAVPGQGEHWIAVRGDKGQSSRADLTIKYQRLHVLPPSAKQKRYPALDLTVIRADERGTPQNRQPIHWRLITDLPVTCVDEAVEKIGWYALRWKNRAPLQDPEIGLPRRGCETPVGRAAGQSAGAVLHPSAAGVLADDAQPDGTHSIPTPSLHPARDPPARSAGQR
ncbi:IS4 family transposase [Microvirga sp.]|uniref:IS4 family transposase n=1 Tax=Microvirga sp. TaxID=1873136 RepID=UPI001FED52E1|nr:IS4 family transposase [Microvirga sp.]